MDLEEERLEVCDEVYPVGHWCVLEMGMWGKCGESGELKRLMPRRVQSCLALELCSVNCRYRPIKSVQKRQMSKKATVTATTNLIVKLIVGAGQASPAPPVGPALGSKGVKSIDFCKVSFSDFSDTDPPLGKTYIQTSISIASRNSMLGQPT